MTEELKKIKNNLISTTLDSLWNEEFYHAKDWGVTPCNSEYWDEQPLRILYDGVYNDSGLIVEFNVGIMSNVHCEDYELFVEDYHNNSIAQHFTKFDDALKEFVKLTGIRNPKVYTDDDEGNAIKIDYRIRPFASVTCD
ncbi:MAG: hypothetical protein SLAVMIC_00320 [uncultured marine phage]|uniref:Uncharacterized protein n=1 Tax=uncultured marine phage TaxID=707152 RepID=A0A8D9C8Q4_9VIRU|nr:MAG: hypothetical protein SLAVMIC_00320 [uncultured marine phage]